MWLDMLRYVRLVGVVGHVEVCQVSGCVGHVEVCQVGGCGWTC